MIYMHFENAAGSDDYTVKDRSMIKPEHRLTVQLLDACDYVHPLSKQITLSGIGCRGTYEESGNETITWYLIEKIIEAENGDD